MAIVDKKLDLSEIQRRLVHRLVNENAEISEVVDVVIEQGTVSIPNRAPSITIFVDLGDPIDVAISLASRVKVLFTDCDISINIESTPG